MRLAFGKAQPPSADSTAERNLGSIGIGCAASKAGRHSLKKSPALCESANNLSTCFAQRLVRAASLIEELTALLRVGYFQRLTKHRLFARDSSTHLSINRSCDKRRPLAPK